MARFYSNGAYIACNNGCSAKLQATILDENNVPFDTDWSELQRIYNDHKAVCTPETPYANQAEAFYGDPNDCYQNEGWFCEY